MGTLPFCSQRWICWRQLTQRIAFCQEQELNSGNMVSATPVYAAFWN